MSNSRMMGLIVKGLGFPACTRSAKLINDMAHMEWLVVSCLGFKATEGKVYSVMLFNCFLSGQ